MGDEEPPEWAAEPTGAAVSRVPLIDECVRAALRARRSAPLDTHAHTLATLTLVYRARFCCDALQARGSDSSDAPAESLLPVVHASDGEREERRARARARAGE